MLGGPLQNLVPLSEDGDSAVSLANREHDEAESPIVSEALPFSQMHIYDAAGWPWKASTRLWRRAKKLTRNNRARLEALA